MEKKDLLNAKVMIGLTIVDPKGAERQESYCGRICEIRAEKDRFEYLDDGTEIEMMIVDCHDGEMREFPFNPDVIQAADPGFYELPCGATIEDPDFEIHWRVAEPVKH